jgi:hypothetical protein
VISAPAAKGRWTGALTGASLVALGVICGRAVVETQAIEAGFSMS